MAGSGTCSSNSSNGSVETTATRCWRAAFSQRAVVARRRKARPVVRQTTKRAVEHLPDARQRLGVEEIHRRAFAHTRRDQPLIENLIAGGRGGFGRFANPEYVHLISSRRQRR